MLNAADIDCCRIHSNFCMRAICSIQVYHFVYILSPETTVSSGEKRVASVLSINPSLHDTHLLRLHRLCWQYRTIALSNDGVATPPRREARAVAICDIQTATCRAVIHSMWNKYCYYWAWLPVRCHTRTHKHECHHECMHMSCGCFFFLLFRHPCSPCHPCSLQQFLYWNLWSIKFFTVIFGHHSKSPWLNE